MQTQPLGRLSESSEERRHAVVVVCDEDWLHERIVSLLVAEGDLTVTSAPTLKLATELDVPPDLLLFAPTGRNGRAELSDVRRWAGIPPVVLVAIIGARRGIPWTHVDAVVLRGSLDRALVPTVRAVLAEQVVFPRQGRHYVDPRALSHREKQVLRLAVEGRTNDEIAEILYLATSTVKGHLTSAFGKLSVASRSEAAALLLGAEEMGRAVLQTDIGQQPAIGG